MEEGHFFGEVVHRYGTDHAVVSEVRFPGAARIPMHAHPSPMLNFVVSGGYEEAWPRRGTVECGRGSFLFHPSGADHAESFSRDGATCLTIELDRGWVEGVSDRELLPIEHASMGNGRWSWAAVRLRSEIRRPDGLTPLVLEGFFLSLLGLAVRSARGFDTGRPPAGLERVRRLLHDRFAESLRIGELAGEAGIDPSRLARLFRLHYGASPGAYLRKVRIEHALRRLEDPDVTIAAVAAEAGFADQSHFTRVFRRQTGTTPGVYRNDLLGERT